jgi:hypothetical protein
MLAMSIVPITSRFSRQALTTSCNKLIRRLQFHPKSTSIVADPGGAVEAEIRRLQGIRNVGILAHVDAGKTTRKTNFETFISLKLTSTVLPF